MAPSLVDSASMRNLPLLDKVRMLMLAGNPKATGVVKISGSLPTCLAGLAELRRLMLGYNSFTGPLPDEVGVLVKLETMVALVNKLQGSLPQALQHCVQLKMLSLALNALSRSIPQAVQCLAHMGTLDLCYNGLRGAIPDAFNSQSILEALKVSENKLQGAIPCAMATLVGMKDLSMGSNALSGSVPVAISSLSQMLGTLLVHWNRLSGAIFDAICQGNCRAWLSILTAYRNRFEGSIPDAVAGLTDMRSLRLDENALSGRIPAAIFLPETVRLTLDGNSLSGSIPVAITMWMLDWSERVADRTFSASHNQLSGSIEAALMYHSPFNFILNDNRLTGTLSRPRTALRLLRLSCNMFEGSIPKMDVTKLRMLDLSGEPGSRSCLRGPLPAGLSRAKQLSICCSAHQEFGGATPFFKSTLALLALHNNGFKAFQCATFNKVNSSALLFNNLLSCHLPECAGVSVSLSVSLLGNYVQRRGKSFPDWVLPMERNSLFLTKGSEGVFFVLQISGAGALLALVVAAKLGRLKFADIMARWHDQGSHDRLAQASSRMIYCIARACLLRAVCLLYLVHWDLYICPPAFAMASATLRGNRMTTILVLVLWCHLTFISPTVKCLTTLRGSQEDAAQSILRRSSLWLMWFFLTLLFSAGSILSQVVGSVPGLMQDNNCIVAALKFCVGALQGILAGLVMPWLAGRLSSKKYALTTVSALLMNVLFPAAIIFCLDTGCLGRWVTLWPECSSAREAQFQRFVKCFVKDKQEKPLQKDGECELALQTEQGIQYPWAFFELFKVNDICDPLHARGPTSLSRCIELTLLRLQDMWLKKLVVAAAVLPAGRIVAEKWYPGLAEGTSKLVILVAYAIAASGHLPLMIPVLLLGMLSETLMTAGSLHMHKLQGDKDIGYATQGLVMIQASSIGVQLAFAAGDGVTLALFMAFVLSLQYQMEAKRSRVERPSRPRLIDGAGAQR